MFRSKFKLLTTILLVGFSFACRTAAPISQTAFGDDFPRTVLWAWERPENLEFLDANRYAVAFLAQTLVLKNDAVIFRPRRQPLKVNPNTKLIAVTRIETDKNVGQTVALNAQQRQELVALILKTLEHKNVGAIQIDFDAAVSEREFYRALLTELRAKMPPGVPLTMTALASFCVGDRWLSDLPVAEAVPMIFRMGADDKTIKDFLANGNDFREPLCRKSYGVATDEPLRAKLDKTRRLYVFKSDSKGWTNADIEKIEFESR